MTSHRCLRLATAAFVICTYQVAAGQAPAAPAPVAEPAPATEPAPAAEAQPVAPAPTTGTLQVLVRLSPDGAPLARAKLSANDLEFKTAGNGTAQLEAPAGVYVLRIEVPAHLLIGRPDATPVMLEVPNVQLAAGAITQVQAMIAPNGTVASSEVSGPMGAEEAGLASEASVHTDGKGHLRGVVISAEDQTPVQGARVSVRGTADATTSGEDGTFTLVLTPGSYSISVAHPDFSTQGFDDILLTADTDTPITLELSPASVEYEDYIVRARAIRGTVAALMEERRATAAVSDAIGSEDISRMPASDAAQAAQRVVGATIVGGRFVYVRGLGERYTNAQLNGAPLPSPEPDRATVPLDLFPAQILESLNISKTFTPDVPGDFAGGSVRIATRGLPDGPMFAASLSIGANSQSTFASGMGQEGSSTDWLGFDDGTRALPEDIPDDYRQKRGTEKPDGERITDEELDAAGRELNSSFTTKEETLPPNANGSILAGSSWDLGDESRIGVLGSLIYRRNFTKRREQLREFRANPEAENGLEVWNRYDVDVLGDDIRWGGLLTTGFDLTKDHKVRLLGMHSQLADKNTEIYEGYSQNLMAAIATTHLEFFTRSLDFGQLQGEHKFAPLNEALLQWNLSLALAQRNEPDRRDVVYQLPEGRDEYIYLSGSESGLHFFADQHELSQGAGLDWTQPITTGDFESKIKVGGLASLRDREFRARRFTFPILPRAPADPQLCGPVYDPTSCAAELFTDENIGTVVRLDESTRDDSDSYNAGLDVYSGYLMGDLGFGKALRVVAGARVESTDQTLAPVNPFDGTELDENRAALNRVDILPALSIVYSFTEQLALRAAGTRTLARPQLRELAPFAFSDYFAGASVSGNPELDLTTILNGDLRLEFFPTPTEVLAISVFVKHFTDPIEPIVKPASTAKVITYANAQGAFLYGIELEARKNLGFMADALSDFSIIGSLMLADSSIEVEQTGNDFLTNLERPLVNQAPYVVNVALDYETQSGLQLRLLYNVSGSTLVEVGTEGLDDGYQHEKHILDFAAGQALGKHFKLRLAVQNILNATHLVTQGKDNRGWNVQYRYREGVTASIGLSYAH